MGKIPAAYVAGALSLADAARVICRRSQLLRGATGKGAMAVVELSLAEAESALAPYKDRVAAAVSNTRFRRCCLATRPRLTRSSPTASGVRFLPGGLR